MMKNEMKFLLHLAKIMILLSLFSQSLQGIGYSDGSKLDTENAINEIEDHLHAIENDNSLPSSEEQSAYKDHFESHQNSLDSISDFADGRHGEAHHSSLVNDEAHSELNDHHHESHHEDHHGKDSFFCFNFKLKIKTMTL